MYLSVLKDFLCPGRSAAPFPRSQNLSQERSNVPVLNSCFSKLLIFCPHVKRKHLPFFKRKSSSFRIHLMVILSVFITGCQLGCLACSSVPFLPPIFLGVKCQPLGPPYVSSYSFPREECCSDYNCFSSPGFPVLGVHYLPWALCLFPLFLPHQLKFLHTLFTPLTP